MTLRIAFAGNPNVGKSALVNAIAGTRLHVGNWPGVTVEKKEATFTFAGEEVRLVDLPGTYSLSSYSIEERVTRDYLLNERPDVVIDVVDATHLERNLFLTLQLLELGIPVVLALNMWDEAKERGIEIDTELLAKVLEVAVAATVATTREGVGELLPTARRLAAARPATIAAHNAACRDASLAEARPHVARYGPLVDPEVRLLGEALHRDAAALVERVPCRWLAVKLLEGDVGAQALLDGTGEGLRKQIAEQRRRIQTLAGDDPATVISDGRYGVAKGVVAEVIRQRPIDRRDLTELIDRVVLHRWLGIPIFFAMLWFVFHTTFDGAQPFVDFINQVITGPVERWFLVGLTAIGAPGWVASLVSEGVIGGAGFVLTFVPILFFLYLFMGILEGSGYMARAAFVMDRFFHTIGLHGKSFIPMILGFGCNVPAVYATRSLDSYRDRVLTSLLIPLMSCSARLPVYAVFVAAFFVEWRSTVIFSLYLLGILLAVGMGFLFKRSLFRGEAPVFVMELPPYRFPTFRALMLYIWEKLQSFVRKAGTYILATSVVIWFFLNLPWGVQNPGDSYFGRVAGTVAPLFAPVGFGTWQATGALLTGVIAKEVVVSTMGEIYTPEPKVAATPPAVAAEIAEIGRGFVAACGDSVVAILAGLRLLPAPAQAPPPSALAQRMRDTFTPLRAIAFMVFVLTYIPCVVTMAALGQELGWRWSAFAAAYLLSLGWGLAFLTYQGGRLLGFA